MRFVECAREADRTASMRNLAQQVSRFSKPAKGQRAVHPRQLIGLGFLTLVSLVNGAALAQESAPDAAAAAQEVAQLYAEAFMAVDQETVKELSDVTMQGAMTGAQVEQTVTALEAQSGALQSKAEAWREGDVQGYKRFRVALTFEKQVIDMRVVVDASDKVAGVSFVEHLEPETEEVEVPGVERSFLVGEGDDGLPGTLLLPQGSGPFPVVVLVHGSGPNDRDGTVGPNKILRDIAYGLASKGIGSLRYDKRSLVNPQSLMAVGAELTVEDEVIRDAQEAVRLLRRDSKIDSGRVFVAGHSLGAGHGAAHRQDVTSS